MSEIYCKVKYCRYPHTHTTSGHICGVIGCKYPYGHGQVEHYDFELRNKLKIYKFDTLPKDKQCTVYNCQHSYNHTNEAHHCYKCKRRINHSSEDCIVQNIDDACRKWVFNKSKIDEFIKFKNNIIFQINVGMGCSLFILKKNNVLSTIFMHSDSWGQYGPETDDSKVLIKFQEGLTLVTTEWLEFNETMNLFRN
uniref:Uncharacterized protein n=1 Tax=Megaviridae environmental sample TaxID=1737588 RepID=A0A5J6VM17_9VIRU|nr:MAG: hypothetical protein [Megaviridae environmental sample]